MKAKPKKPGTTAPRQVLADDDAIELYRWLTIPRVATVTVMVAAIAWFWFRGTIDFDPKPVIFGLVPIFLAASATVGVLIMQKIRPLFLLVVQLVIDTMGVTAAILMTGGIRSPFIGMYVLVIVSAGIISTWTAVGIGLLITTLYGAMAWIDRLGGPVVHGMSMGYAQTDAISLTVYVLIVALVAFQSQFYARRIRQKDEELLKLKDEFLFRTIHDLRSPSTVIRIILEKYGDPKLFAQFPEFKDDVGLVQGALGRMTNLIEDLLKIGRGEQTGFVIKKDVLDTSAVMAGVLTELGPVIAKKKVTVNHETGGAAKTLGDLEKLKEAFNNFVENAVKYNRDGGTIAISYRKEKRTLAVIIADTGIGISEKSLEKLFMPYFRGDIGAEIQGTGLGLYMTKRLIEKMGGAVTVASKKGEGTTFTVTLPLA
jgi:signal transduction histidine kinase